jgi:spore coat protein H
MLRNHLSLEFIRQGTWLPASRSSYVDLSRNGASLGLYLQVERLDEDYVRSRGLDPRGSLFRSDPPRALAVPGGNLSPLENEESYREIYDCAHGDDWDGLVRLIEDVLPNPDADLGTEIALDDLTMLLAVWAVLGDQDHVRKNFGLFGSATSVDPRWVMLPWDLDLTFGHVWNEVDDVLGEQIVTDGPLDIGVEVPEHDFQNALIDRVLSDPAWRARWEDDLRALLAGPFSREFFEPWIQGQISCMGPALLADPVKRATNEELEGRVEEILSFVDARRSFVEAALAP